MASSPDSNNEAFKEMLDLLPAAVYRTDITGAIVYYNSAAIRIWGGVPEIGTSSYFGASKIYRPDGRVIRPDEGPTALALRDQKPHHGIEVIAERPDGTRVPFIAYATPIFEASGRCVGTLNMLIDHTERRKSELVQERLAAIVNGSDDAIISKDLNGIITTWNPGAQRIFGYSAEEVLGRSITILIPEDQVDEEPQILARLRRGEHIDHYETIRRRKDGTLINISLTVSPLRTAEGKIVGASKIARDITESKRQQEQQKLLLREMKHRVKNTISTVLSIATQTLGASGDRSIDDYRARLVTLAAAHDLLTAENWRTATLSALVLKVLKPFQETYGERIAIDCNDLEVTPDLAQTLALVLHELATNAVKYGALSNDSGSVSVKCAGRLLEWQETGGPEVVTPSQHGFGSKLLRRALVDHSTQLEYRPEGLYFAAFL